MNIKAIIVSLAMFVVFSGIMGFVTAPYFIEVHEEITAAKNGAGGYGVPYTTIDLLRNPLYLCLVTLISIVTVGIPGYVAAFIGKNSFIMHSMLIGVAAGIMRIYLNRGIVMDPYIIVLIALDLGVAYAAGATRAKQLVGGLSKTGSNQ